MVQEACCGSIRCGEAVGQYAFDAERQWVSIGADFGLGPCVGSDGFNSALGEKVRPADVSRGALVAERQWPWGMRWE